MHVKYHITLLQLIYLLYSRLSTIQIFLILRQDSQDRSYAYNIILIKSKLHSDHSSVLQENQQIKPAVTQWEHTP